MILTIEKLVYGGDGLARLADDATGEGRGKAVFVPFVLPGEQVEAELVEQRPGFARARLGKVIAPSPQRIEPQCPYFGQCGGCQYQHAGYEQQVEAKRAILLENLRRLGKLDWTDDVTLHRSPPWQYRNLTRVQLSSGPPFTVAYFRHGSHELLAIEQCPISSPLINRAITALNELGRANAIPAAVEEAELFADDSDARLLLEVYLAPGAEFDSPTVQSFWERLQAALPESAGVTVFAALPREHREPKRLGAFGVPDLLYRAGEQTYRVSAGSFFQSNRHLTTELLRIVTAGQRGELALDLYAGVGLFACALAPSFKRVIAVEAANFSFRDLRRNAPPNVQAVQTTAENYLADARVSPDLVIVDPPRSGLGEKVARAIAGMRPRRMTYVSCDPATLSRDLKILVESGLRVIELHLVDLFPQTFHIETVVQLTS